MTHPELPPNCPYFKRGDATIFFTFPGMLFPFGDNWSSNIYLDDLAERDPVKPVIACVAAEYWRMEEMRAGKSQKLEHFSAEIERQRRIAWTTANEWRTWGGLAC